MVQISGKMLIASSSTMVGVMNSQAMARSDKPRSRRANLCWRHVHELVRQFADALRHALDRFALSKRCHLPAFSDCHTQAQTERGVCRVRLPHTEHIVRGAAR